MTVLPGYPQSVDFWIRKLSMDVYGSFSVMLQFGLSVMASHILPDWQWSVCLNFDPSVQGVKYFVVVVFLHMFTPIEL